MEAKGRAEGLARIDGLTGIYNRRAFYEYGENLTAQSKRSGMPLSAIVLDLDFFKRINDQHGHGVGDRALTHLCTLLTNSVRTSDICGRIGGEEFAIVLPGTALEPAAALAEVLRDKLERSRVDPEGLSLPITASFGVAEGGESLADLLQQADTALYRAKELGRNQVVSA